MIGFVTSPIDMAQVSPAFLDFSDDLQIASSFVGSIVQICRKSIDETSAAQSGRHFVLYSHVGTLQETFAVNVHVSSR